MEKIRIGLIGTGYRGALALKRFLDLPNAELAAVCDLREESVRKVCSSLPEKVKISWGSQAWKEMCLDSDVDLVYVCTPWQTHAEMATTAMRCGKDVAVEVPVATSVEECLEITSAVKETGRRFMMLENCIYDPFEAATYEMYKAGLFGNVYHAEGGYIHRLEEEQAWRKRFSDNHHGDVYPTHGAGPICRLMDIGSGDSFKTISSFETEFDDGIHTTSIIKTALGKTVILQHNVHARSPYSRIYKWLGTRGSGCKYPDEHITFGVDTDKWLPSHIQAALLKEFEPKWFETVRGFFPKDALPKRFMDYAMDYRLMEALLNGSPTDMNVYDAACWSSISELSRISLEKGSIPVEFPDFK